MPVVLVTSFHVEITIVSRSPGCVMDSTTVGTTQTKMDAVSLCRIRRLQTYIQYIMITPVGLTIYSHEAVLPVFLSYIFSVCFLFDIIGKVLHWTMNKIHV